MAIGAALLDCGRVDDKTAFELHHQSASRALANPGLTHADVDGFCSVATGHLPPIEIAAWEMIIEHAAANEAGHPGMRGIFLLVEALHQLRGTCRDLKVDGASVCCVNATGGWSSSASTILLRRG